MFLEIRMLTYQAGVQMRATVVHIVTFYIIEGSPPPRGNGWFWQVGWVGVPTYLGVKYDTWVCHSGFRTHQTFLEMVTQFELSISIDAFFCC
jgi:hypothetical protein